MHDSSESGSEFVGIDYLRERLAGLELRVLETEVIIDFTRARVEVEGVAHSISLREQTLLQCLARANGKAVPSEDLAAALYSDRALGVRRVNAIVSRLRLKLFPRSGSIKTEVCGYSLRQSIDLRVISFT